MGFGREVGLVGIVLSYAYCVLQIVILNDKTLMIIPCQSAKADTISWYVYFTLY